MPLKCRKSTDCPGSKVCGVKKFCKARASTKRHAAKRHATKRHATRHHRAHPASTSMVAGAVLGQVGTMTAQSLVTKHRSSKLGAGMGTMVSLTRRKLKHA